MTITLLLLGFLCLAIGFATQLAQKRKTQTLPVNVSSDSKGDDFMMPEEWNELAITQQLGQLRSKRPALLSHFLDSVMERFVVRQDDQTAQTRLKFLKTQIEQLQLAKEFQQAVDDLEALVLEKQKRTKALQLDNLELDHRREVLTQKQSLEVVREQRRLELEIAEIETKIEGLKNAAKVEAKLSPEQQRAKEKAASESRIQNLKKEKQEALKIEDEQERVLKVNAIDDALQREFERWAKIL